MYGPTLFVFRGNLLTKLQAVEVVVKCVKTPKSQPQLELLKANSVVALPTPQDAAACEPSKAAGAEPEPRFGSPPSTDKTPAKSSGVLSFITNSVPSIFKAKKDSGNSGSVKQSSPKSATQNQRAAHDLEDCSCGSDHSANMGHTLPNCVTNGADSKRQSENQTSEHSITNCDTIVLAGQRSPKANRTTYAHDFTEYQVDAEILEYFERQEQESIEHNLAQCLVVTASASGSGSPTARVAGKKVNSSEQCSGCDEESKEVAGHRLSACPTVEPPTTKALPQHDLADCQRTDSVASPVHVEGQPQPEFRECCVEDAQKVSCIARDAVVDSFRHDFVDLAQTQTTTESTHALHSLRSSEECDLCDEVPVTKQHRLSNCSRSSSMSALNKSGAQQHRLSQCPRSSSMPVIVSRPSSQHEIDECPQGERDEDHAVTSNHVLDECEVLPIALSQGEVEVAIVQPKRRKSKGKQRANEKQSQTLPKQRKSNRNKKTRKSVSEDLSASKETAVPNSQAESCNGPKHAELILESSKAAKSAKHPDVTVEVDVMVAGKKINAEVIPVFDGPVSARPSQIRKASTQQALSNVLAAQKGASVKRRVSQKNLRTHPYQQSLRGKLSRQSENSQENDVVVLGTPGPETVAALAADKNERQSELSAGQRLFAAVSGLVGGSGSSGGAA